VNSAVHGDGWDRLGTLDMGSVSVSVSVDFFVHCKLQVCHSSSSILFSMRLAVQCHVLS